MKKLLLISTLLLLGFTLQYCSEDDVHDEHADGHLHVTATLHDEVNDVHNPTEGAFVQVWFNKSSAEGAADYEGTTGVDGSIEFEELEAGIYFITASITDEGVEKSGSALAEISEAVHEVEVEVDME